VARARDDEDTDPEGPSLSGRYRIPPTTPEEGALSPSAAGAWRLILLVGAILGGASVFGVAMAQIADYRVGLGISPVEKKIDEHLSAMLGERRMMEMYVAQQTKALSRIEAKLDRLCAASARASVCLGGE
jgi:hypothetical protein